MSLGVEGIAFCSGMDLPCCFYCLKLCGLPGCRDCEGNKSGDNQQVYEISNPSGASTPSDTALLDMVFSVKVVNHEQTSEGDPPPPIEPLLTQWLSPLLSKVASRNLILLGSPPARANNGSFLRISSKSLALLYRVLENRLYWASHFLLHTIIGSNSSLSLAFLRGNFELARL